jgi:cell division protein FtsQ
MIDGRHTVAAREPKVIRRWGFWLMIPLVVGTVVLCMFALEWRASLKVKRVIVEGARLLNTQQVITLAGIAPRVPLENVDIYEVRTRVLGQPFVKTARVNRNYPDAVRITITERVPIASVNTGQLRYIDDEGMLLPYIPTAMELDLPVINGVEGMKGLAVGDTATAPDLFHAIDLLRNAQEIDTTLYHFISEVNMNSGGDITLFATQGGVPIYLGRGDIQKKLLTLESFWGKFVRSSDTEKLAYVDLRFTDQVIVRWLSVEPKGKESL